ncbi:hypothetical protein DICVIV_14478, partial [Dictyocaulus viviparus]
RDIMFVSNIDNTGATLDLKIAQFACDEAVDYIMECTTKTQSDIKKNRSLKQSLSSLILTVALWETNEVSKNGKKRVVTSSHINRTRISLPHRHRKEDDNFSLAAESLDDAN